MHFQERVVQVEFYNTKSCILFGIKFLSNFILAIGTILHIFLSTKKKKNRDVKGCVFHSE